MSRPPNRTAKARGRELEWRVRDELRAAGYVVTRSAGSGGAADLWAARGDRFACRLLLVQVKRDPAALGSTEWNALLDAAQQAGGLAVLATAAHRCSVVYWMLTDRREPRSRMRPWRPFHPND